MDSEISRLIEFESRQNRGIRIRGRKAEQKVSDEPQTRVNPRTFTTKASCRFESHPHANIPLPTESNLHSNTKLPNPDLTKTVKESGESSRKDAVLTANSLDKYKQGSALMPNKNSDSNKSNYNKIFESRNFQLRATPTSLSSSKLVNPKRPTSKPPPPPPPHRVDSAVVSERPERALSV